MDDLNDKIEDGRPPSAGKMEETAEHRTPFTAPIKGNLNTTETKQF
jgi:hypothetical protein